MKKFALVVALLLLALPAKAQVSVAPLQLVRQQFFSSTGVPLAGGCLVFDATGTSNPQAIYTDSTGLFQAPNPYQLDAAGMSNVWMTNTGYDLTTYTGVVGQSCSAMLGLQLWKQVNVNPFSIINNGANYVVANSTSDPAGVPGELGYRTDLACLRIFTSIWDCLATLNGTQTLANKTLTSPVINNAVGATLVSPQITGLTLGGVVVATGNPTNFANFTNGTAGTTVNLLAKLINVGAGSNVVNAVTADTGGIEGITIGGAGSSGIALVQRTGQVLCVFDGSTTALDYVQISSTTGGDCHDTGSATYPVAGGQVIGRALTTNTGAGSYLLDLFGPEIKAGTVGAQLGCTNFTPVPVSNNNAQQNLMSCSLPANLLAQGAELVVDMQGINATASAMTITLGASIGGGTPCTTTSGTTGAATNQPWHATAKLFVLTAGSGGTANWSCNYFSTASGGGVVGPFGAVGVPTISLNTTISNILQITVQMSVANAGNSVTEQGLKAVVY